MRTVEDVATQIKEEKVTDDTSSEDRRETSISTNLNKVPVDILLKIFSFLSHQDLARIAKVNRHLNVVANADVLWLDLLRGAYPNTDIKVGTTSSKYLLRNSFWHNHKDQKNLASFKNYNTLKNKLWKRIDYYEAINPFLKESRAMSVRHSQKLIKRLYKFYIKMVEKFKDQIAIPGKAGGALGVAAGFFAGTAGAFEVTFLVNEIIELSEVEQILFLLPLIAVGASIGVPVAVVMVTAVCVFLATLLNAVFQTIRVAAHNAIAESQQRNFESLYGNSEEYIKGDLKESYEASGAEEKEAAADDEQIIAFEM